MAWTVEFTPRAQKALADLREPVRTRVIKAIARLADDPYASPGVKKLVGQTGFRLRVGEHRVLYELRGEVLLIRVLRIANRREA